MFRSAALPLMLALLAGGVGATVAESQPRPREMRDVVLHGPARGWIGLSFEASETPGEGGVVREVRPGSPAEEAGLEAGDRVVAWNGRADILRALRQQSLRPGETVLLRVVRDGVIEREIAVVAVASPAIVSRAGEEIVIRPGEMARYLRIHGDSLMIHADSLHSRLRVMLRDSLGPRLRELERSVPEFRMRMRRQDSLRADGGRGGMGFGLFGGRSGVGGAELTDLTPGLASYFGTTAGVLVLSVGPETPAARAGLRDGDVVVRVGGEAVGGVAEMRRAIAAAGGREIEIEVLRQRVSQTLRMGGP